MSTERIIERKEQEPVLVGEQLAMAVKVSMEKWQERRDLLLERALEVMKGIEDDDGEREKQEAMSLRRRARSFVGWGEKVGQELEETLVLTLSAENGEVIDFAKIFGDFIIGQLWGLQKEALEGKIETIVVSLIPLSEEEISAALEFFRIRRGFTIDSKGTREGLEKFWMNKGDMLPEDGILPPFLRRISELYPDPNPKSADHDENR